MLRRCWGLLVLIHLVFVFSCCESSKDQTFTVALSNFPDSFNPVLSSGNQSLEVNRLVYEFLQRADSTSIYYPYLVSDIKQTTTDSSLKAVFYPLRTPTWSDGKPLTAEDIAFSVKLRKTPVAGLGSPFQLGSIESLSIDPTGKIELGLKGNSLYALVNRGDFMVIPEHVFDSLHIWRKYDLEYLSQLNDSTAPTDLLEYARAFSNIPPYDPVFFQGSGPYRIETVVPDQSISLVRREDWWKEVPDNIRLPQRINFVVIPDATAARFALQNGEIDLMTQVPANEFTQLEQFNRKNQSLNLYRQAGFRFAFLGFNTRKAMFSDQRTRLAIAHLLDIPAIIEAVKMGYADETIGPVHPVLKDLYNDSLPPYKLDTAYAVKLLKNAGWSFLGRHWQNSDGKVLEFTLRYNAANRDYEKIAVIVKDAAAKAGISITLLPMEGGMLNQKLDSRDFEAVLWSFVGSPTAFDFSPLFHSNAVSPGLMNFTGFSTPASDEAIKAALTAPTLEEMGKHLKVLQAALHEQCPMIFLYFEQSLIASSKKFLKLNITYYRPGYDPVGVF